MTRNSRLPVRPSRSGVHLALFLMAGSVLMHEIVITRIFSVTMWYHFAFMAISIAMFGMTTGAVIVYLRPHWFSSPAGVRIALARSALLFGVSAAVSLLVQLRIPHASGDSWNPIAVAVTYIVVAVPYVFAGVFVAAALTRFPADVSRLYAADLAGAAAGCLGIVLLLEHLDGVSAVFVAAAVGAASAVFVRGGAASWWGGAAAAAALLVGVANGVAVERGGSGLRLLWVKGRQEAPPLYERWNSHSRIIVRGDSGMRQPPISPSLSPFTPPQVISQLVLEIDAAAATILTAAPQSSGDLEHFRWDLSNLAHHVRSDADVLVVGVGGGRDVLSALAFDQRSVTGVEVNRIIVETLADRFADFTGHLPGHPRVRIVHDEARGFLERTSERFDIIQISMIDTWAATAAGAFVFTENSLYTMEAWRLFLRRLTDDGVLSFTRWYSHGFPGEIYRLAALGAAALREHGASAPRDHIVIVRHMLEDGHPGTPDGVGTMLVSREPFRTDDLAALDSVVSRLGFERVVTPAYSADTLLTALLADADLDGRLRALPLDISPPTDDDPFFFQMLRPLQMLRGDNPIPQRGLEFNLEAMRVLGALLVTVTLLALLVIVVPVLLTSRAPRPSRAAIHLLFFAAIGLGFMFIEIAMLQRLDLFLGHPTYSIGVALASLLLGSGLGSQATAGAPSDTRMRPALLLAGLLAILVVTGLLGGLVLNSFVARSLAIRAAVGAAVLLPLGFFMGVAFPLGMKATHARWPDGAPWLWGINGAFSVVGSVAAMAVAVGYGISALYWIGFACYILAALSFALIPGSVASDPIEPEPVAAIAGWRRPTPSP